MLLTSRDRLHRNAKLRELVSAADICCWYFRVSVFLVLIHDSKTAQVSVSCALVSSH